MRTFNVSLCNLNSRIIPIGYEGENLYTRVQIDCVEVFSEYPNATAGIAIESPSGDIYPVVATKDGNSIVWEIMSSVLSEEGNGRGQLTFMDGETVIKSEIFNFVVYNSLVADGEMPDPVEDWIAEANNKLGEVEAAVEQIPETIDAALEQAKASGEFDGEDGFSPVVSVTEITDGHRVSVTDAEGTETFDVMNGEPGQPGQPGAPGQPGQPGADGVSPTVSVTPITDGHEVTITDATGSHTFDVMNGEKGDPGTPGDPTELIDDTSTATNKVWSANKVSDEVSDLSSAISDKYTKPSGGIPASDLASGVIPSVPVQDVQVNGVSVLSQGVANVPVASANDYGVVKTNTNYGTEIAYGNLAISGASGTDIRAGTNGYKIIAPRTQHTSVFYGLAKAAGADMASLSSVTVGQYPEAQKIAIQKMLGIYQAPWELIREDTVTTLSDTNVQIDVDGNGNAFELTDIRLLIIIPPRESDTIITDYGLVMALYDNSNKITVSLTGNSPLTIPSNQDWMAYFQIESTNGMSKLEVLQYQKTNGRTNMQMPAYYNTTSNYYGFSLDKLVFKNISINHVTGTIGYRLFGRRKWN